MGDEVLAAALAHVPCLQVDAVICSCLWLWHPCVNVTQSSWDKLCNSSSITSCEQLQHSQYPSGSVARHQELEIEYDFKLNGPGLEVLPRCCPSLKALRLKQIPFLFAYFLPDLQHLAVSCSGVHGS